MSRAVLLRQRLGPSNRRCSPSHAGGEPRRFVRKWRAPRTGAVHRLQAAVSHAGSRDEPGAPAPFQSPPAARRTRIPFTAPLTLPRLTGNPGCARRPPCGNLPGCVGGPNSRCLPWCWACSPRAAPVPPRPTASTCSGSPLRRPGSGSWSGPATTSQPPGRRRDRPWRPTSSFPRPKPRPCGRPASGSAPGATARGTASWTWPAPRPGTGSPCGGPGTRREASPTNWPVWPGSIRTWSSTGWSGTPSRVVTSWLCG